MYDLLVEDLSKMSIDDRKKINQLIKLIKKCKTWDYIKDMPLKDRLKVYTPLIGDPCYKYSKMAKENFFTNPHLSFLFLKTLPYCLESISKNPKLEEI
jgi:hypothetical protein